MDRYKKQKILISTYLCAASAHQMNTADRGVVYTYNMNAKRRTSVQYVTSQSGAGFHTVHSSFSNELVGSKIYTDNSSIPYTVPLQ